MFDLLKQGYNMNPPMFSADNVRQGVTLGWITQEQCDEILGTKSENPINTGTATGTTTTSTIK